MVRKTVSRRARAQGKRAAALSVKLKALRSVSGEFDAKKYTQLVRAKAPRKGTKAAKARALALRKVASAHKRIRPYLHRPHKLVKVRSKANLKSLRKYVGMGNFKKLRAVPVPTDRAKSLKVTFDKKRRVKLTDGGHVLRTFLFPHRPRAQKMRGRIVRDQVDDLLEMVEKMLPTMPDGTYVLMSRHHFLIPTTEEKPRLLEAIRAFAFRYKAETGFLSTLYGFQLIEGSYERALEFKQDMASERGRMKRERKRIKYEAVARELAAADRALKSGKVSKRARATGRR